DLVTDAVEHSALDTRHWRAHPVRFPRMDRGALGEVGVDPHHRLRSPLTPGVSHAKGAASRSATAKLALLVGAAIVAPRPHGNPLWILADPLRDVVLLIPYALLYLHLYPEHNY